MNAASIVAAVVVGALPLGVLAWLVRRLRKRQSVSRRASAAAVVVGAALGLAAVALERTVFDWADVSLAVRGPSAAGALLTTFLFVAPLEETLKAAVIWPLLVVRKLRGPPYGLVVGVASAAGFSVAESTWTLLTDPLQALTVVRVTLAVPAHLFCTGLIGYAFGSRVSTGKRWVGIAWIVAVTLSALYTHIVFGRGPGVLALALPLLVAMGFVGWFGLREVRLAPAASATARFIEPPTLRTVQRVLRRSNRPLMLGWIVIGTLVNVGVVLACVALAVYLGHQWGIDFAAADEADMRSNGPIVLLGTAVLAAFPAAGYLVARASAATNVLEPALGAGFALFLVVAMLSVTAPIAVLFALAVAPIAFALACSGAWFGIR